MTIGAFLRLAWTAATFLVVQILVCGVAALPVARLWGWIVEMTTGNTLLRFAALGFVLVPSYALFALCLIVLAPLTTRLLGWRTPANAEMRIAEMGWPVLGWARYMASLHVVRVLAGSLFRGSPIWSAYLRLSGARVGRRVYIASLALSDYNLLEFGDDVVIGSDAHISAHTVERGLVKTAGVRLGDGVLIGLGAVVDIGVEAGDGCQVGALSFVPKYTRLEAGGVYAGIPVERIR